MLELDTVEEWQNYFDERFPNGVVLTIVAAGEQLNTSGAQLLALAIRVDDVDEDGHPHIGLMNLHTGAVHRFMIEDVAREDADFVVLTTTEYALYLSDKLSEDQQSLVSDRKKGLFA